MQWGSGRKAQATRTPIPQEIWVLVSAAFIIALGYGLVAPILPQFARSFDVSIAAAGAVISAFAAMRLLFAPSAGALVNRVGSRRVYLIGLLTVAVSTLLVATAGDYWHVLILRALGGIGSTMFTVSAMGLIVRIAPQDIRGRASSIYSTAFLLGNIIGPIVGAALSPWGMRLPFVLYGVALILATIVVAVKLQASAIRAVETTSKAPPMELAQAWKDSAYRAALCSAFAHGWANMGLRVAILPIFAAATFHRGAAIAGFALTAFAVGNAIVLQFSGKLADTYGRRIMILTGLSCNTVFTAAVGWADHPLPLLVVSALAGAGAGLMNPAQQATLGDLIGRDRSGGTVLSTFQMAQDLGAIVAPIIVGMLVGVAGYRIAFLTTAITGSIALVTWLFARETLEKTE